MKRCPTCGRSYTDANINFCLDDGELLMDSASSSGNSPFADDSPSTVVLDPSRQTNPSTWQPNSSPPQWQTPSAIQPREQFGIAANLGQRDQTLPTIALVLAICSCFLVCCSGGIWLGLPAAVVGFLGMRNADSNPTRYSGRGLAVAGMVIGIVTFLASIVFLFFGIITR